MSSASKVPRTADNRHRIRVLIISIGLIVSGIVRFVFFPNIESDYLNANVQMSQGTPASFTFETALRMQDAIYEVKEEAEADGEDVIAIRHIGYLGLLWDHRAFDGSTAVLFLQRIKQNLEGWDWEQELA